MARTQGRGARRRDETGAAVVEFALVVPIMLALLMGIITFAMAYNQSIALNNTAREGARFGATTANDDRLAGGRRNAGRGHVLRGIARLRRNQPGDKICAALVKAAELRPSGCARRLHHG